MSRIFLRLEALAAIGALLFASLSVAAYACPNATSGMTSVAMPAGCPDQDTEQPNLCKAHCAADQQQASQASADLPPLPLVHGLMATLFVPVSASLPPTRFAAVVTPARTTSPPFAIRNCCFRL